MVTHDEYFLDRVTNADSEFPMAAFMLVGAEPSRNLELKAEREEMELASERKKQSVSRMAELEWAKRGCRARSTKQRARLERLEALKEQERLRCVMRMWSWILLRHVWEEDNRNLPYQQEFW